MDDLAKFRPNNKPIEHKPLQRTTKEKNELRKLGFGKQKPFDVQPQMDPKSVVVDRCELCQQPFRTPVAVCYRCGNCVFCGAYNHDRYANTCLTCGNDVPGRSDDTTTEYVVDNRPQALS